jgi:hypothetical protein
MQDSRMGVQHAHAHTRQWYAFAKSTTMAFQRQQRELQTRERVPTGNPQGHTVLYLSTGGIRINGGMTISIRRHEFVIITAVAMLIAALQSSRNCRHFNLNSMVTTAGSGRGSAVERMLQRCGCDGASTSSWCGDTQKQGDGRRGAPNRAVVCVTICRHAIPPAAAKPDIRLRCCQCRINNTLCSPALAR